MHLESSSDKQENVVEKDQQSATDVKDNSSKTKECEHVLSELRERFVKISADFQNYKRRVEKDRLEWMLIAQHAVFVELLNIVDDLDRALEKLKPSDETKVHLEGMKLIRKSLYQLLEKYNVKQMTDTTTFDPEKHEAIIQVDSDKHESGHVVEVMQKGFMFKDRVLRPAKVSVAK